MKQTLTKTIFLISQKITLLVSTVFCTFICPAVDVTGLLTWNFLSTRIRNEQAIARSIDQGRGLRFPYNDRTDEVNKLVIIWPVKPWARDTAMWHWSAGGLVMPRKSWLSSQLECANYCSHTINSLNQELKWPVNVMLYLPRNVKWRAIASLNKQVKTSTNQTIFTAIIYYKALNQILGMKAAFNKLE